MTVWLVLCDWSERTEIRALYSTREQAENKALSPEPCPQASCTGYAGTRAHQVREGGEFVRYTADAWQCIAAREHGWCCSVREYAVDVEPAHLVHAATA